MAGRRNRRRRRCLSLRRAVVEEDGAWTESERRAMKRRLLDMIHRYYVDAVSRLPAAELRSTLACALLVAGHCFGPLHPVHNILVNSLWYAAAFPHSIGRGIDMDVVVLSTHGIARLCLRSLDGLLAFLRHRCPSLSPGDALWHLLSASADLATATALAKGTNKSHGLRAMSSSQGLAAFRRAANAARHPNPTPFAQFASSSVPAQHNIFQLLVTKHALSARHITYLSSVLAPPFPYQPPIMHLTPSPLVLHRIEFHRKQFKDIANRVLNVVSMALQEYTLRSGEQLMLHSVCGASLLKEDGLNNCYHINFLANHRNASGSALGVPVLLFTEAIVLACDETDIRLCVPVDPVTDIGYCFACETNKKKLVHPFYDEFLGGREFQVDEVDLGSDFPYPLDVDYIFFDAGRDWALANYLDDP